LILFVLRIEKLSLKINGKRTNNPRNALKKAISNGCSCPDILRTIVCIATKRTEATAIYVTAIIGVGKLEIKIRSFLGRNTAPVISARSASLKAYYN
jgi:hypothetical protein